MNYFPYKFHKKHIINHILICISLITSEFDMLKNCIFAPKEGWGWVRSKESGETLRIISQKPKG